MNTKSITRKYKKLLQDVSTKDFYKIDLTNRVNCYICTSCNTITKTIDVDAGVTPMFFQCSKCTYNAKSTGYKDIATCQEPSVEWYRPSLKELVKKYKKLPHVINHVLCGGLLHREIKKNFESCKSVGDIRN